MQRTILIFYPSPQITLLCIGYSSLFFILCHFFVFFHHFINLFFLTLLLCSLTSLFQMFVATSTFYYPCCFTEVFKSFQTASTYFEIGAKAAKLEGYIYKSLSSLRHLAVFILKIIKNHDLQYIYCTLYLLMSSAVFYFASILCCQFICLSNRIFLYIAFPFKLLVVRTWSELLKDTGDIHHHPTFCVKSSFCNPLPGDSQ